jgi:hypothetical protein
MAGCCCPLRARWPAVRNGRLGDFWECRRRNRIADLRDCGSDNCSAKTTLWPLLRRPSQLMCRPYTVARRPLASCARSRSTSNENILQKLTFSLCAGDTRAWSALSTRCRPVTVIYWNIGSKSHAKALCRSSSGAWGPAVRLLSGHRSDYGRCGWLHRAPPPARAPKDVENGALQRELGEPVCVTWVLLLSLALGFRLVTCARTSCGQQPFLYPAVRAGISGSAVPHCDYRPRPDWRGRPNAVPVPSPVLAPARVLVPAPARVPARVPVPVPRVPSPSPWSPSASSGEGTLPPD